jgi:hypothetical protein
MALAGLMRAANTRVVSLGRRLTAAIFVTLGARLAVAANR